MIVSVYNTSIAGVAASPEAIAAGIGVGEATPNAVLGARVGDHRNDPELAGYPPGSGPDLGIRTPPASANPQTPVPPVRHAFGFDDPGRLRPYAPPALDISRTDPRPGAAGATQATPPRASATP